MSRIKLLLTSMLFFSNSILATSPNSNNEKTPAQAFFISEEIPAIGNFTLEQLQILQVAQALTVMSEARQPELVHYYSIVEAGYFT